MVSARDVQAQLISHKAYWGLGRFGGAVDCVPRPGIRIKWWVFWWNGRLLISSSTYTIGLLPCTFPQVLSLGYCGTDVRNTCMHCLYRPAQFKFG